jgi:hypothetical protein
MVQHRKGHFRVGVFPLQIQDARFGTSKTRRLPVKSKGDRIQDGGFARTIGANNGKKPRVGDRRPVEADFPLSGQRVDVLEFDAQYLHDGFPWVTAFPWLGPDLYLTR